VHLVAGKQIGSQEEQMSVKQIGVRTIVWKGLLLTTALGMCAAPAAAQQAALSPPAAQTLPAPIDERSQNEWMASLLFGTNFQANTDRNDADLDLLDIDGDTDSGQGAASFAFSGQIGYLWNYVGIEGLFDFTPSVDVTRLEFEEPSANSYMANLLVAIPTGRQRRFQPYLSGGLGAISMSASGQNIFLGETLTDVDFPAASQTRFGWNLGIGASAFGAGAFGIRGDVRYFRAGSSSSSDIFDSDDVFEDALDGVLEPGNADVLTRQLLSGLAYWRANLGLALRW
jgi:opacity protein-like surface antigen